MAHFDRHHISDAYRSHSVTAVARSGLLRPPDQMCLHDLHYPWILRGLLPTSSRGPCAVVCAYLSVKQKEMVKERGLGCFEFLEWCSTQTHRYHTHHTYNTHYTHTHTHTHTSQQVTWLVMTKNLNDPITMYATVTNAFIHTY